MEAFFPVVDYKADDRYSEIFTTHLFEAKWTSCVEIKSEDPEDLRPQLQDLPSPSNFKRLHINKSIWKM